MAKLEITPTAEFIGLTRSEAVELITFLTAQLAGVNIRYHALGVAPEISIIERGARQKRMVFYVENPELEAELNKRELQDSFDEYAMSMGK